MIYFIRSHDIFYWREKQLTLSSKTECILYNYVHYIPTIMKFYSEQKSINLFVLLIERTL